MGQPRENGGLVRRVPAVDIERLVGLGVAQAFCIGEDGRVGRVVFLHLREDVVTGAVEDAVDPRETIGDEALAQGLDERNTAGDAGFEKEMPAVLPRRGTNLRAMGTDQRLVG